MSKPISLLKFELLEELYDKHKDGVPIEKLKRQYKLEISSPTLAKHIRYYYILQINFSYKNPEVYSDILASLNPEWREKDKTTIFLRQPLNWRYRGTMPLGYWEEMTYD